MKIIVEFDLSDLERRAIRNDTRIDADHKEADPADCADWLREKGRDELGDVVADYVDELDREAQEGGVR